MHHLRYVLALCLVSIATIAGARGVVKQDVYMFGFSASFNDSIVYFTNIQEVKGYIANDRTHFLVNRDDYSYQLRNYFDNRGQAHRTCVTIYSTDKEKAEKKYAKMKAKYTTKSKNKFDVMYLTDSDFKFQTVAPDDNTSYVDPAAAERAAKEAEKAAEKAKKAKEAKENANTSAK